MNVKRFLVILLAISVSCMWCGEDVVGEVEGPERLLVPARDCIFGDHFALILAKQDFADAIAPAYADITAMKYLRGGKIMSLEQVRDRFLSRANEMSAQNPKSYYWVVVTSKGLQGVFSAKGNDNNTSEVTFLLLPPVQGCGLTKHLLEAIFRYLPDRSWKATAHPDNVPSCRSLKSSGFVYEKTEFVEDYGAPRKFYSRPSNDDLEKMVIIRFPYSGKEISLADLFEAK